MEHIKKVLELLMVLGVKWVLSEAQTTGALRWNWLNAAEPREKLRDSRGRERGLDVNQRGAHATQESLVHNFHYYKGIC